VRAHGMEWRHLPIRDVDVPDQRFEAAWALIGPELHDRLAAGDRILIHCRGGLGRTGLVAGACSLSNADVIRVQPCAVFAQCGPMPSKPPHRNAMS
jgi:protein-tyrosine phosphatase